MLIMNASQVVVETSFLSRIDGVYQLLAITVPEEIFQGIPTITTAVLIDPTITRTLFMIYWMLIYQRICKRKSVEKRSSMRSCRRRHLPSRPKTAWLRAVALKPKLPVKLRGFKTS